MHHHGYGIFGLDRVGFFHRQKNGIQNVVVFSSKLIALKQAEADEEGAAEDGIPRDESHGRESKEEDRQQGHGQPEFFIKQVFHEMPPSRGGSSLLPGFRPG